MRARTKRTVQVATWDYWWNLNKWDYLRLMHQRDGTTPSFSGDEAQPGGFESLNPELVQRQVIPTLKRALKDTYGKNREAALIALGKTASPVAQPDLMAGLRHREAAMRDAAILGLGMGGRPDAVAPLTSILRDLPSGRRLLGDPTVRVPRRARYHAAFSLGLLKDAAAIPHLTQLLRGDEDDTLRVFAAAALGVLGDREAVPLLCEVVADKDEKPTMRATAAVALSKIRSGGPAVIRALMTALGDRDLRVVRGAVVALGGLVSPDQGRVIERLCARAERGGDTLTRGLSCIALGRIGGAEARRMLSKQLRSQRPISGYAALGLALSARGGSVEPTARMLREAQRVNKNPNTRSACSVGLGLLASRADFARLTVIATKARNPQERAYAMSALGMIGDPRARPVLRKALKTSTDPFIQHEAALALGLLGEDRRQVADALAKTLEKADHPYLRAGCALSLGLLREPASVDRLKHLAVGVHVNAEARTFASGALGLLADRRARPALYQFRSNNLYYLDLPEMRRLMLML